MDAEGSSSVQTLGGMSGAIIVEDPEGSLPPEVEAMREVVMVLQETNIESGERSCVLEKRGKGRWDAREHWQRKEGDGVLSSATARLLLIVRSDSLSCVSVLANKVATKGYRCTCFRRKLVDKAEAAPSERRIRTLCIDSLQ